MKRAYCVIAACLIAGAFTACKEGGDSLEYSSISAYDWVQANVQLKQNKQAVMWFTLFDQIDNEAAVKGYQKETERVDRYPASIFDNKFVWILVNNRFEIRLTSEDKSPEYQNTEKLKGFLRRFDLAGMEGYSGPKLSGEELRKFIPKLK
ncbi:MAG: hypothetical protein JXA20_08240 [Spirochaetes bacterium]|nr:hypothetical protein [Spirochaetota bacterium]